jgi:hypothetical protein
VLGHDNVARALPVQDGAPEICGEMDTCGHPSGLGLSHGNIAFSFRVASNLPRIGSERASHLCVIFCSAF